MKTITVEDREYQISFKREYVGRFVRGHGTVQMLQTTCRILRNGGLVTQGIARLNNKDQDVRKRGYKHALKDAMRGFCQTHRAEVWRQMEELFV